MADEELIPDDIPKLQDDAALQPYGDVSDVSLDEEIVFYRSVLAELPLAFFIFVIFLISLLLSYIYPQSTQYIHLFSLFGFKAILPIPLFLLIPVMLAAYYVHRLYDAKYIIGADYVRAVHGLLSFEKSDTRLEFLDIRGIETKRGVYGRLVNTGTLHIGTAMKEEEEMFLVNIYNPSYYRDVILRRRNFLMEKFSYRND